MKAHIFTIERLNGVISAAEAKISRVEDERVKYHAACAAAVQTASALRDKAGRALAMAAVGEHDEKAANSLVADADAAKAKAEKLALTLSGMDQAEQAAKDAAAAARLERAEATRAALNEHAQGVAEQYAASALTFVVAARRVRAIESLRRSLGDMRPLFRTGDGRAISIPALYLACDDLPRTGEHGQLLYYAMDDLTNPEGAQAAATEAEIALLAKAGLEI